VRQLLLCWLPRNAKEHLDVGLRIAGCGGGIVTAKSFRRCPTSRQRKCYFRVLWVLSNVFSLEEWRTHVFFVIHVFYCQSIRQTVPIQHFVLCLITCCVSTVELCAFCFFNVKFVASLQYLTSTSPVCCAVKEKLSILQQVQRHVSWLLNGRPLEMQIQLARKSSRHILTP